MLKVRRIRKEIKGRIIIKDATFKLNPNEIIALVGPNGSGKTTLFKMLTSLLQLDSGTVQYKNLDLKNDTIAYLKKVSFMQDSSVLYPDLTGCHHLKFISGIKGNDKDEVLNIIGKLGMDRYIHKKVGTYSLGMKQSLLLGLSMLSRPDVLLLDEPFNGLDPTNSESLMAIITTLKDSGTTIFFSSHILSQIDEIADRIFFLKNGELIREIKVEKGKETYELKVTSQDKAMIQLKENENIFQISTENNKILVTIREGSSDEIFKSLSQSEAQVLSFTKKDQYSQDIYRELYEEEL